MDVELLIFGIDEVALEPNDVVFKISELIFGDCIVQFFSVCK